MHILPLLVETQGTVGASLCVCIHSTQRGYCGGEPVHVHTQYTEEVLWGRACACAYTVHRRNCGGEPVRVHTQYTEEVHHGMQQI